MATSFLLYNFFMIGIDIEDISRFKDKDDSFLNRVFTPLELEYCLSKKNPAPHLAARFCAKEAVFKALSSFGIQGVLITQIEIYNDSNSCPRVRFLGRGTQYKVHISLSHEKEKAIAFAMLDIEDFKRAAYHPCAQGDEG